MRWIYCIVAGVLLASPVAAEPFTSNNYRIDESFVGGSGAVDSSSANFRVDSEAGAPAVGDSSSTSFQTQAGPVTTADPALSLQVNSGSINFGSFSTATASTATASFTVQNYTSYGYIIQIIGTPPKTGSYTLTGLSSQTASAVGSEQFGINLKANTSPAIYGANPSGGQGVAATGYEVANQYKYVSGDVVASAPKSSTLTTFTISYLVNVATKTAGGSYSTSQAIVCTGTY